MIRHVAFSPASVGSGPVIGHSASANSWRGRSATHLSSMGVRAVDGLAAPA